MAQFVWPKREIYFLMVINSIFFGVAAVRDSRIVNGEITEISKHPYIVAVHRRSCGNCAYEHYCAGTIYNENTIITARDCVESAAPQNLLIVAGSSYRTGFHKDGGIILPVNSYITHHDKLIDLAIVNLALKLPLNSSLTMQAATLATSIPPAGTSAVIAGWGRIEEDGVYSEELREAFISILELEQCQSLHEWFKVTDNEICAGYVTGVTGVCQGDAGGPLIVDGKLVGVNSWDAGCAQPHKPGIYTNVVKHSNWILSQVLGVHAAFL